MAQVTNLVGSMCILLDLSQVWNLFLLKGKKCQMVQKSSANTGSAETQFAPVGCLSLSTQVTLRHSSPLRSIQCPACTDSLAEPLLGFSWLWRKARRPSPLPSAGNLHLPFQWPGWRQLTPYYLILIHRVSFLEGEQPWGKHVIWLLWMLDGCAGGGRALSRIQALFPPCRRALHTVRLPREMHFFNIFAMNCCSLTGSGILYTYPKMGKKFVYWETSQSNHSIGWEH